MIAEGLKPHEFTHGVVIYDVPKDIDFTDPQIIESLKEVNHCMKLDTIARIISLRRNETKGKYHPIIVFSKYSEELNTWIERGFSIKYQIYRTKRYIPRIQSMQCFNCYGYGHHVKTCRVKTCCGKCGDLTKHKAAKTLLPNVVNVKNLTKHGIINIQSK